MPSLTGGRIVIQQQSQDSSPGCGVQGPLVLVVSLANTAFPLGPVSMQTIPGLRAVGAETLIFPHYFALSLVSHHHPHLHPYAVLFSLVLTMQKSCGELLADTVAVGPTVRDCPQMRRLD